MKRDESITRATRIVMSAIDKLQDRKGTNLKNIMSYITSQYEVDNSDIRQSVLTALRRGVTFGFLKKRGANYRLADQSANVASHSRGVVKVKHSVQSRTSRRFPGHETLRGPRSKLNIGGHSRCCRHRRSRGGSC